MFRDLFNHNKVNRNYLMQPSCQLFEKESNRVLLNLLELQEKVGVTMRDVTQACNKTHGQTSWQCDEQITRPVVWRTVDLVH